MDSGTFVKEHTNRAALGARGIRPLKERSLCAAPGLLAKSSAKSPSLLLRQYLDKLWTRKNIFIRLFFHASHSSRPSFQKSKTIFTAFWFRAAKEPPNFCLPCHNKKKHVNLALVKFSQHTPKMPLLFSLFLACNLVFVQKGQQGWKQKHWARGDFMVKNSGFSSHERNKYLHTSAFQPQMI